MKQLNIAGEISKTTLMLFELHLNDLKNENYILNIQTNGGSVQTTTKIIKAIKNNQPTCVQTRGIREIKSAGLYLIQAGIIRTAYNNCMFGIHRHIPTNNKSYVFKKDPDETEHNLFEFLSDKANISFDKIIDLANKNYGQGTIFDAFEAQKYGFIDEVLCK